jgi:hypothetical protein
MVQQASVRQTIKIGMGHVESAMRDLLKDKPYMHSDPPRPAVEDPEPPIDDDPYGNDNDPAPPSIDVESEDENNDPPPLMEDDDSDDESNDNSVPDEQLGAQSEHDDYGPPHPNTIVLPVETRPTRSCETEHAVRPAANERDRSPTSTEGELVRGINIIEQINAHM